MKVTDTIYYIGVNDKTIDLFEGQYIVPNGMAYNSHIIIDEKIAITDTVDVHYAHDWFKNIRNVLGDKAPDYLIVHHMEPDHSANIELFTQLYPHAKIVASAKAFTMMSNFFGKDFSDKAIVVGDGDTLDLGTRTLTFYTAPMVHWPEVVVSFDDKDKVLFSADAFGKFGALDADEDWACEARRYYFGIVGKYGAQVQVALKKLSTLDIQIICPLHGPVLKDNLGYYIDLYNKWSTYTPEDEGVTIAYATIYGNTEKAAIRLAEMLKKAGCPNVGLHNLAKGDMAEAVEDAFRYSKLVLASSTYNNDIFPFMRTFIDALTERNFQNRTVAFIENGSWAPNAKKVMSGMLEKCKNLTYAENSVKILSSLNTESSAALDALADELCKEYTMSNNINPDSVDNKALFNIGYGLYIATAKDGDIDNGTVINSVAQVTSTPNRIAVTINKGSYSHDIIKKTGVMNINCLKQSAGYSVIEEFGFKSGRNENKFEGMAIERSENGLAILPDVSNSYISLKVEQCTDLDTHSMFICTVTEAKVINNEETMTYTYYQDKVKPKAVTEGKKGFVCTICGWIYDGDTLPADIECPICSHGAEAFEPIK